MTLDGAFTNKRWRHQAGMLCNGCTLQMAHHALCVWTSFFVSLTDLLLFYHPISSANSFSDMTSVRVSGCAATCTFRKCATTRCLGSRKGVCTSSGFMLLTRPGWDVPPRLVTRCVRRTLWNIPGQQVQSKPATGKTNETQLNLKEFKLKSTKISSMSHMSKPVPSPQIIWTPLFSLTNSIFLYFLNISQFLPVAAVYIQ